VKAVQIVLAVDDDQGIGGYLALRTRLIDGHCMAVVAQQADHVRAGALQVARVVHDDVQPAAADVDRLGLLGQRGELDQPGTAGRLSRRLVGHETAVYSR